MKAPGRSGRWARCAPRSRRSLRCLRRPSFRSDRPLSFPPAQTARSADTGGNERAGAFTLFSPAVVQWGSVAGCDPGATVPHWTTAGENSVKAPARSARGPRCALPSLRSVQCFVRPPSPNRPPLSFPPVSADRALCAGGNKRGRSLREDGRRKHWSGARRDQRERLDANSVGAELPRTVRAGLRPASRRGTK